MSEEWKKGLLIGIAASLLFAVLVQPLLGMIGNAIIGVSGLISSRFSDWIYRNAARGVDYSSAPYFIQWFTGAAFMAAGSLTFLTWRMTSPSDVLPDSPPIRR